MLYDFVMSREVFFIQDGEECLVIKSCAHCVYQKCRLSRRIVASSFVCPRTVKAFKLHCLCLPLCTFYCFLNALTAFMNFAPRKCTMAHLQLIGHLLLRLKCLMYTRSKVLFGFAQTSVKNGQMLSEWRP